MQETRHSEVVAGYELSVVKWADRSDDVTNAVSGLLGIAVAVLSCGGLGWGFSLSESRWLVQVRDRVETEDVRTVRTTFTRRGARRAARRVRAVLASGDEQAVRALPDYVA